MLQDEGEFADVEAQAPRAKICEDSYGADDLRARAAQPRRAYRRAAGEAEAFVQEAHSIHAKAAGPSSPAAIECMPQIVRLRKQSA